MDCERGGGERERGRYSHSERQTDSQGAESERGERQREGGGWTERDRERGGRE